MKDLIHLADYDFYDLARKADDDPEGFLYECNCQFLERVRNAASHILAHLKQSPVVLLSGPSGSGKTTTAKLLEIELEKRGVSTNVVSLDNYYKTLDPSSIPKDKNGDIDFESPDCLDIALLTRHIDDLSEGREVMTPRFDFMKQARDESRASPLRLGANEVAIFEGIHALNPILSGSTRSHAHAQKLYVSARSNIIRDGSLFFKGTWIRLIRRLIRDEKFRGAKSAFTLSLWANVRRGEKMYISPFKDAADIIIDSSFPYEVCVLRPYALPLVESVPDPCPRREELLLIHPRLMAFSSIHERLLPHDNLLREFIGGGSIQY